MASGYWGTNGGGSSEGVVGTLLMVGAAAAAFFAFVLAPLYNLLGAVGCGVVFGAVLVLVLWRLIGGIGVAIVGVVVLLVLVGVFFGTGALLTSLAVLTVVEGGATASALLDWLEADVALPSRRAAWAYGHLTMLRRTPRRLRHWRDLARDLRKHRTRELATPWAPSRPELAATAEQPMAEVVSLDEHRRDGAA